MAVPLVMLLAGLLFAATATTAKGTSLRSSAASIPDLIRAQNRVHEARAESLSQLRNQVNSLALFNAPGDRKVHEANEQADLLAPHAGTQEVTGPAVTVTLDDSKMSPDNLPHGMTIDDIVVHQQDVQAVVNALWAGGAEAMMLMDQRVISTSAVRCVGNTLILQGRVYSPPFIIKAIGNPRSLKDGLAASPQIDIYQQYVAEVGLGYSVKERASETFPAFAGSTKLQFATVPK